MQSVNVRLRINYRNTNVFRERVQDAYSAEAFLRGAGGGPNVRRCAVAYRTEADLRVASEFLELVVAGGLALCDMTILSPVDRAEFSASAPPAEKSR